MNSPRDNEPSAPTFDPGAASAPGSGLFGLDVSPAEAGVHVIPVPFDITTSYRKGTAQGPAAVFRASHQIELFDRHFGRPYEQGIAMREAAARLFDLQREGGPLAQSILDVGGAIPEGGRGEDLRRALERVNRIGDELNAIVHAETESALDAGALPCVLGGDHSVPFGAIAACAERYPGMGVLHFDAHHDLRVAFEGFEHSHASIFYNVAERVAAVARIVQVGIRDFSEEESDYMRASDGRIRTLYDDQWAEARLTGGDLRELVRATLAPLPHDVYVSFDIDGLDPTLCPNTGTPVPGGLSWPEARLWLTELVDSGRRVVGLDVVEVAPAPDQGWGESSGGRDGIDAIVGARLLYALIGAALRTRAGNERERTS